MYRAGHKQYTRPSVAQTLMARLPRCFELVLESLVKNPIAADLELFRVIFFFILEMVNCVFLLELPQ